MKHQEGRMTNVRWYMLLLVLGTMMWALSLSYISIMLQLLGVTEWFAIAVWVKWLTWIAFGFVGIILLLPREARVYEREERQENKKVGNREK
jgi:hypothetical protein